MTQTPSEPGGQNPYGGQDDAGRTPPPMPLGYQGPSRMSGMAVTAMILGILSIPLSCVLIGMPLAIVALVLGIISLIKINREPMLYGGKGMAITGIVTGIIGTVAIVPLLIAILLPSLGRAREIANRTTCGTNLKGIMSAMIVYSSENADNLPLVPFAPYGPANAGTSAAGGGPTEADTVASLYSSRGVAQNGSPLASVWLLVVRGDVGPKNFICKSDVSSPASVTSATGNYFVNFQSDTQLSYSVAYPYDSMGRQGDWWKATIDSSLPLIADMAPLDGTGTPVTTVSAGNKSSNSGNHMREGQNVGYADGHDDFVRSVNVGQDFDNIYTTGGPAGASRAGTQPRPGPIMIDKTAPQDIVLVPARNLDTGKFW